MTASAAAASGASALVTGRLYRSLLRASKPFTSSPNAKVLTCLLYRSDADFDGSFESLEHERAHDHDNRYRTTNSEATGTNGSTIPTTSSRTLYLRLAREMISGDARGVRLMNVPSQVDTTRLRTLIRREFRGREDSLSHGVDSAARRHAGFLALRELNTKLAWEERLKSSAPKVHPFQAAAEVQPLPLDPSAYLQPGCFLLANPHLDGYFRRTVILILDHNAASRTSSGYGTYGLIVNRPAMGPSSAAGLVLQDVLHPLPTDLAAAFSTSLVHEGGPVHMSLQMLHAASCEVQEEAQLGGHLLVNIPSSSREDESPSSEADDRTMHYSGDLMKVAAATRQGQLDRHRDVLFFVGASTWSTGQLESEVERGYWIPCRGPVTIALTGTCRHGSEGKDGSHIDDSSAAEGSKGTGRATRPNADLWLSMMSACGPDEAALAHLMFNDDGEDELGAPCDGEG